MSGNDGYGPGLSEAISRFGAIRFEEVHAEVLPLIPDRPGAVLDVGAGSGRDAEWFAAHGWDVVAVEPSADLRRQAALLHPHPGIRWLDDRLPGLETVHRLGATFDLVWISAVWMHVAPSNRQRALRKLVTLLRPGGRIMFSLRHGPDDGRGLFDVDPTEIERHAAEHGLQVLLKQDAPDRLGRFDVRWTICMLALPDDASGALPLLRSIILSDSKTSTYKVALLRVLLRIADSAGATARPVGDTHVAVPLGLVALFWVRMFKPLIAAGLPQLQPRSRHGDLAFVKAGFRALEHVSPFDLRLGMCFAGPDAAALRQALADAAHTIARMPATYITFTDGQPVFPVERAHARVPGTFIVDVDLLASYGRLLVPTHLWMAFRRLSPWIEPMLISEWLEIMREYADRRGESFTTDAAFLALRWLDPQRETAEARRIALSLLEREERVLCIWTGKPLSAQLLDIDHCFPWAAWPCGDLWNLMPADRVVNQQRKKDRLVSAELLHKAHDRITEWWNKAYWLDHSSAISERFEREAQGTLPIEKDLRDGRFLDEVFTGVDYQRMRLRHDQRIAEWNGA